MTTYTTIGPVRECCGHEHRTVEAARGCIRRDGNACRRQGGYSDREVYSRTPDDRAHRAYLASVGSPSQHFPRHCAGPVYHDDDE